MLRKNIINKLLSSITLLAVMGVYSNVALAQVDTMGALTVTGTVTVNGSPAVSNSTVLTDSKITTGAGSGAVVSLGKNGSVELFENTTIDLKFTANSIVAMLTDGKIRVMNAAGIGATVTTRTATVVADTGRANSFVVSLGCGDEDDDCRETFVETFEGLVTMTTNNDQTLKQIPAGAKAVSADTCSQACMRPGVLLPIALADTVNTGLLAAIFGGIGAAVLAAVFVGGTPVTTEGTVPVVSPSS